MHDITDIADVKRRFLAHLTLTKGMSRNTAQAYSDDVDKLTRFLAETGVAVDHASTADLETFVSTLHDVGIQPRSQARIISGVKSFYKFLRLEGYMDADPTELLLTPKIGRHLPEVLTIDEIDAMIDAIDMSKPEGQRNRAIIETLYGCGLRVSELIGLQLSQLFMEERYVIILGKGNKQRLVPISPVAIEQITLYLEQTRAHQVAKRGSEDILFLNRRGAMLTRQMIFHIVKQPQFCHPPARGRCQPACYPADVGPREHHHHRNLRPHRPLPPARRDPHPPPPQHLPIPGLKTAGAVHKG